MSNKPEMQKQYLTVQTFPLGSPFTKRLKKCGVTVLTRILQSEGHFSNV